VQTRTLHESFEGSNSSLAFFSRRVIASRTSRQWETHAVFGFLYTTGFLAITLVPDMLEGQSRAL